tara:strand:- start:6184 stop:6819 length:636 start_codon:yes stop_codon:yes gene_type:complete
MKAERVEQQELLWDNKLKLSYESNERTGVHVSDLLLCLRQTALSKQFKPKWDSQTLYRFTMGRSLEKVFFSDLMPVATQELEVELDGIVGHIDFGADPIDYECKLTWSRPPTNTEKLFEDKFWWVEQAGAYTYMRNRTEMNFVVCFLNPIPKLMCYHLEWDEYELEELWSRLQENKEYLAVKNMKEELPMKTPFTWLCRGCAYKEVCDDAV